MEIIPRDRQRCEERLQRRKKRRRYSITSSARASRVGGIG
jgi:hypothetical protein